MSDNDPVLELDDFASGVTLSKLADSRPDPLTDAYVTQWARACASHAAVGQVLLQDLYDALPDDLRHVAESKGFGSIAVANETFRMEMEDIISEITDGDQDYVALASKYLDGKDAMDFVVQAALNFYMALGRPAPATLRKSVHGKALWRILSGTGRLSEWMSDLGVFIDALWGPDDNTAPPTSGGGVPGSGSPFTQPGELWHDSSPSLPAPVPVGMNPLVHALDEAKSRNLNPKSGDVIHVYTQPYTGLGLAVGVVGWTPGIKYVPWWGAATLVLHGTGLDTSIIQPNGNAGFGTSWQVGPTSAWEGRMVLVGFRIICSGANAIGGGAYGDQNKRPLQFIRFVGCDIVDGPNPCTRPVSMNQASIVLVRCLWNCYASKEHAVYSRNPVGPGGMIDCVVDGVGGQIWQEVARPSEGPTYPSDMTLLDNLDARNYHQDPGRAGSGVTQAGSGRKFKVRGGVLRDIDRSPSTPPSRGSGLQSFGAHVSWTGGVSNFRPLPGGFANDECVYEDVDIVHKDGSRALMTLGSVGNVQVTGCGIWGEKGVSVIPNSGSDALLGDLLISDCNTAATRKRILARLPGLDTSLLVDGPIRFGTKKSVLGVVSDGVLVKDGAVVTT